MQASRTKLFVLHNQSTKNGHGWGGEKKTLVSFVLFPGESDGNEKV